jgi:hypothetical protein
LEDLLNSLEVLFKQFKEGDLLALEFVLDDRAVEESFEGVKKLKLADDGVAVVEGLGED